MYPARTVGNGHIGIDSNGMKRKQIVSMGKGQPEVPQAAITITVFFLKNEMQMRKKQFNSLSLGQEDNMLAPFGSPECFNVMQGELVYQVVGGHTTMPRSFQANPVSNIAGIGCVNGLKRGTILKCVGMAATANMVTNEHSDNIGTVQTAGVCTIVHTGAFRIPANSTVVFDEIPYTTTVQGQKICGVLEIGQPGSENRSNINSKFRPALYHLTDTNVPFMIESARDKLMTKFNEICGISKGSPPLSPIQFENVRMEMEDTIGKITMEKPSSMPLADFLRVHFCQMYIMYFPLTTPENIKALILYLKGTTIEKIRKEREVAMIAIGETSAASGPLFQVFDEEAPNLFVLSIALFRLKDLLVCNLHSWIQSHIIGRSRSDAMPGQDLRLSLLCG